MGSVGSPKSRVPYDAYKDCAQGICNKYCPHWCNYPPPLDSVDDSGTTFSPLIIALICILVSAFLLVSYYAIVCKYCKRRRRNRRNPNVQSETHLDEVTHDQWQLTSNGLDEGLIRSITVFKYKKGDGLVEGTECSVCLSEFQENENLRLLPKCCHAFHPPCIDTWLKSQSNCPLCRANAVPIYAVLPNPPPPSAAPNPPPPPQNSSALNISALETQRQNDLVFVIEEEMIGPQEFVGSGGADVVPKNLQQADSGVEIPEIRNKKIPDNYESTQLRRSISLGKFSRRQGLMIADIMQMNEDDEKTDVEIQQQSEVKIGSSKGSQEEQSK